MNAKLPPRNESESRKGPFTGWHLFAIMLCFFGVIIAVNFTMAAMASNTWTGLIVKNSYVASQDFNDSLAQARKQKELGWETRFGYSGDAVRFEVVDATGEPVMLDRISVKYGRPAHEQLDANVDLAYVGGGVYEAQVELSKGEWSLELDAAKGDQPYRLETRVLVGGAK